MVLIAVEHAASPRIGVDCGQRCHEKASRPKCGHRERQQAADAHGADIDGGRRNGKKVQHRQMRHVETAHAIAAGVGNQVEPAVKREQKQQALEQQVGPCGGHLSKPEVLPQPHGAPEVAGASFPAGFVSCPEVQSSEISRGGSGSPSIAVQWLTKRARRTPACSH